ncbi:MAG TPA: hypothetical protein VFS56_03955 [Gemmatimonadaceae bacterium]|nr:hypothetical protein [Gemmatimonadaceae bacterium]
MTIRLRRMLAVAFCIVPVLSCTDPVGVDELSDFMILAPGDYYFTSPITIRPRAVSADSVIFRWEESPGAESYSIIFSLAASRDSLDDYLADINSPVLTIPVAQPQRVMVNYGVPNPQLDTVPVAQYPALQHVVYLRDLDALLASYPVGQPIHFVWSMLAHKGSQTGRSIELHRLIVTRT